MTAPSRTLDRSSEAVAPIGLSTCVRAVAQTVVGAVRPRRPTARDLAAVADAELPHATTTVTLRALPQIPRSLRAGTIAEGVRGAPLRIGLRTYVVEHPRARILLDPAVCLAVRSRALAPMPTVLRRAVRPPADILSTVEALHMAGLSGADFDIALPTHLHWDHVCGLLDLPDLAATVHRREWDWAMSGDVTPVAGVRPAFVDRPVAQYDLDGPAVIGFPRSHDLFGDGSVVLVDLAGHTPGSVGVLLHTADGWVLFAGDAAWHSCQVELGAQKPGFPGLLADEDREATFTTLVRLHVASHRVHVLPAHDHDMASRWAA